MAHIVIDARIINSSTGHYVEYLLHHLQKIDRENRYTVLIPQKDRDYWKPTADNFQVVFANQAQYSMSEQFGLALLLYRLRPDLVHFCMPQQPLLYFGKRVTTVHDTTLVRFENIDGNRITYKIKQLIFTLLLKNILFRSKAIFTPSNYVRKDLLAFSTKRYSSKIKAILLAGEIIGAKPEKITTLANKDFIFFVGNAFPYKNLPVIVDAYQLIQAKFPKLQLVFAGKPDVFYENLQQYVSERKVHNVNFLGYISDGEKRWLFQNAKSYVVASLSEGFHMPLLEAMEDNCPVISSSATCLPEVAGNAALYFDPYSVDDLASQLTKLLSSKSTRDRLIKAGTKRASELSWDSTTRKTHQGYIKALKASV
ncbi:MAG TPA: glycosyltransferase family 1 protein [Candidatus Saccharimonadales bacterium]